MPIPQMMKFRRFGRCLHLRIDTADDLEHAIDLDESRWVATGAPMPAMNCDPTFLKHVDTDHNERIMCFEVKAAIRWLFRSLDDRDGITRRQTSLKLEAIDTDDAEGAKIHAAALKILDHLDQDAADEITLEQTRQIKAMLEGAAVSEAGVVLPEAAEAEDVRRFLADVIATVNGVPHPSGQPGVSKDELEEFLAEAKAYIDWRTRGEDESAIMPLGADTGQAFALLARLREKIDQYFAQCEAVALDERAAERIRAGDEYLEALDLSDRESIAAFMTGSPLAMPRPDGLLRFAEPINPCYAADLARLREDVVATALDKKSPTMSKPQWQAVKSFFAAHAAWLSEKSGAAVEKLGLETLREYSDDRFRTAVQALIAESDKTSFRLDNVRLVEKAILYQANMLDLANNFVSFPHLYDPSSRAMFEMGSLVMDGRRLDFAVRADHRVEHAKIAKTGNMFVLYVEVLPSHGEKKYDLAVPVTAGGKGNLCVGKRGVFQDVFGGEFDARVVEMIENPISLGEAFVAPFKRLSKLLVGKIESITATAEKKLDASASATVDSVRKGEPQKAPKQSSGLLAGGLLMGGGVAIAALGSSVAYITRTLASVETYKLLIGVVVAVLAVLLPTSLVSMLKLRKRDLSAILEGSGWAINARMRLTRRQSRTFTRRPKYAKGAHGIWPWWAWVLLALIVSAIAALVVWYVFWHLPAGG